MRTLIRTLSAVLLGLCASLPLVGGDEENLGGDTGVWILPRSGSVVPSLGGRHPAVTQARENRRLCDISRGISVQASSEVGLATAVLRDPDTNTCEQLSVQGSIVRLDGTFLVELRNAGIRRAEIVLCDENGAAYYIVLVFDTEGAMLYVF